MMRRFAVSCIPVVVLVLCIGSAWGVSPSDEEKARAEQWLTDYAAADSPANAFSFIYDAHASSEFLGSWKREYAKEDLSDDRVRHILAFTDPATALEVTYSVVQYRNHAALELLLEMRNGGGQDTPILEAARPLDVYLPTAGTPCTVHRALGESNSAQSFAPVSDALNAQNKGPLTIAPNGGRSSDGQMPFFNLEWAGQGLIVAIGWAGQWQARFACEDDGRMHVDCGMETFRLKLHPGEAVRTPRVLLQFWQGGEALRGEALRGAALRGNNLFRQWMLACNLSQKKGEPIQPPICASVTDTDPDGSYEGPHVRAMKPLAGCGIEVFWSDMDPQQWYPRGFPEGTGTWEPDPAKYPNGLKPIGDAAHAAGLQYLLWFEPERVAKGTRIEELHPEWITQGEPFHLFKLHIPEARAWLTDYIDKQITEGGVDWLRWDFNMEPLGYWRKNDEPDRQGMTEIRHVEGLYAMWEDLMRRHPGLVVDICASGGRRIDFETLRYGLPLWHSDMQCSGPKPAADQLQNGGLFLWLPLHGCGNFELEPSYVFRSAMTSGNILIAGMGKAVMSDPNVVEGVKRSVALYKKIRPLMLGDFYPLFPHPDAENVWYGYQFHRPDLNAGFALVFRRQDAAASTAELKLRELSPSATYEVTFQEQPGSQTLSGERLGSFPVEISSNPGSAILFYRATAAP